MTPAADSPRTLTRLWLALLLAPTGWITALGVMFVLTGDACGQGTRRPLWITLVICMAMAICGTVLAWREQPNFMARMALGLGAVFGLVLVLMAVPVVISGACRT